MFMLGKIFKPKRKQRSRKGFIDRISFAAILRTVRQLKVNSNILLRRK